METLEQCFGRPEVIVDKMINELRTTKGPGITANELNAFAVKVQNIVTVLLSLDTKGYIYNPTFTMEIMAKLSPHLRHKWSDYAFENNEENKPELVLLSHFLMREANRTLRYARIPMKNEHAPIESRRVTKPRIKENTYNINSYE